MQTYATCRILEQFGHKVSVINLIHPKCRFNLFDLKSWKDVFRELLFIRFKLRYFPGLTKKMYYVDPLKIPIADITIVGSDQVWNKDITGIFGYAFFLDFVNDDTLKISLASSFGKDEWDGDTDYTKSIKRLLDKFHYLSVRESTGVTILHDVFQCESIRLVDPTIAWGSFGNLLINTNQVNRVFPFLLNADSGALAICQYISRELKLPLFKHNFITSRILNGPSHWITRIHNSSFIITDSFHGLVFSILFRKQFVVLCANEAKFTRLSSLLKLLSLEHLYVRSVADLAYRKKEILSGIDYKKIEIILAKERNVFMNFVESFS